MADMAVRHKHVHYMSHHTMNYIISYTLFFSGFTVQYSQVIAERKCHQLPVCAEFEVGVEFVFNIRRGEGVSTLEVVSNLVNWKEQEGGKLVYKLGIELDHGNI